GLKEILTAPSKPVVLTGNVSLDELDVVKLPQEWSFESSEDEGAASRPVSIKVNVKANRILYHGFSATNVAGSIAMKNQTVDVSNLRFNALDGNISADLRFAPNSAGYLMNLDAALNNINISRALDEWNNFGQSTVTSTNLKGRATANLSSDIYLDQDYNLIKDELRVDADVEISGGELIEFEPLQAMSRFISVDELKRVQFDTLRNRLSIRNSKLVIPKMSVSSNILNVQVFGEHAFDQEMDYHVNLLLNDLLRRKAKKKKTFEGHEIVGEGGKTRLFLWVRGKPGDLKVGYDKREVRKKLKDDFKKEGQTIKQLFKEEFGGAKEKQEESEEVQFRLEEDDDVPTIKIETETPEPDKPKKKKKKKRGLFSSEPDEGETEGGFEIEFEP
ncbi:MAG: AsmA-like C-terminal region-containing protein, partial [Flavobacteriales bacterium]